MSDVLANLIAKKFIARSDVKAIQFKNGSWAPHNEYNPSTGRHDGVHIPWRRQDLNSHLAGSTTYGHYLLNPDSECKLFAFDIDLEQNKPEGSSRPFQGYWPEFGEDESVSPTIHEFDPRSAWLDRAHPSRSWTKYQFKTIISKLMKSIHEELELPCAAAYSGGKGVHVYAFTGPISASDAREGARIVLDSVGGWSPSRGDNFFRSADNNPVTGFPNLSIEVFPKQNTLDGKDLGNLMRLPLGRNLKSSDPTFFIDVRSPMGQMVPVDPIWALSTSDPWGDA